MLLVKHYSFVVLFGKTQNIASLHAVYFRFGFLVLFFVLWFCLARREASRLYMGWGILTIHYSLVCQQTNNPFSLNKRHALERINTSKSPKSFLI